MQAPYSDGFAGGADDRRDVVSVIVPTTASSARGPGLLRAIDAIRGQAGVRTVPIIVANGNRFDSDLRSHLAARKDIRYVYQAEGSLPAALRTGRALVDTEFFAELDDDDELLPNGLSARVAVMRKDESADLVVANGFLQRNGSRRLLFPDFHDAEANPIDALAHHNWLASCAGLFKTATVRQEFFEDIPPYLEWTYLAFRFALKLKVRFLNEPTFVCNIDTEGSLSKTKQCRIGQAAALRRILDLNLPAKLREHVRRRLSAALHNASNLELDDGNYLAAWKLHLLSLSLPGGVKYAGYTRHLFGVR